MAEQTRARVVFTGTVQGVGFRYTARGIAASYAVTGYVRNESDGSVTLVAEGEHDEVKAFIAAVSGRMDRYIQEASVTWSSATGEFDSFGVGFSW